MKSKVFFTILFCSIFKLSGAQLTGLANYRCIWTVSMPITSDGALYFNNNNSIFKSITPFIDISKSSNENDKGIIEKPDSGNFSLKEPEHGKYIIKSNRKFTPDVYYKTLNDPFNIYTDVPNKKLYQNIKDPRFAQSSGINTNEILTEENFGEIEWIITDENKNISGFQCTKATAKFRGRDYIAWFTPDIPVNFGPWKLNGLPGLILEAYDLKQEVIFLATEIKVNNKIDNSKNNELIDINVPNHILIIPLKDYIFFKKNGMNINNDAAQIHYSRQPEGYSASTNIKVMFRGLQLEFEF